MIYKLHALYTMYYLIKHAVKSCKQCLNVINIVLWKFQFWFTLFFITFGKDVAMAMVLLQYMYLYFSRYRGTMTYIQMCRQSHDNKFFLDRWVAKISKVWSSACTLHCTGAPL